jgi:hypothetical protein
MFHNLLYHWKKEYKKKNIKNIVKFIFLIVSKLAHETENVMDVENVVYVRLVLLV